MPNFILDLLINVVIALIAALFAVRISLHKFSSQKWWERREETYAQLIGTLSRILIYTEKFEEHYFNSKKLTENELNTLNEQYKEDEENIKLIASEGAFRISEKSNVVLNNLIKIINKPTDEPIEEIDHQYSAVKKCLKSIKKEPDEDLRIKKKWYQL